MILRKFTIDKKLINSLSLSEKKIVELLGEVVEDISKVYELQLKEGFYAKGIDKLQLESAARTNPAIISPFTYIDKTDSNLTAIPYHIKYSSLLQPIADKIDKAAEHSENKSFKKYLNARAKSLRDGSYKEADEVWFEVKDSPIDFSVGPFERYLDKYFFVKRVFQSHVGIIDNQMTEMAEDIKDTLYTTAKYSFDKSHSTDIPHKGVNVFIEETPVTSGYMSDVAFSGEHFPSDLDLMKRLGSKILIYESQMKYKFEKLHYPIFKAVFEKSFANSYPKELLLKATVWNILLYELSRQLHKFPGSRERLKEVYGVIDESNGAVSGIQHAKHLVVKGLISHEELEAIMIVHIVWMFADWLVYQKNKNMESYVKGNAIALNTYLKNGALKEKGGISWPNFSKIFFEIENLAEELAHVLEEGSYDQAQRIIRQSANINVFERFTKNLKGIEL